MKHDDIERLHKAIQHLSDVLLSVHDQTEEQALEKGVRKGVEDAKSHLRFNPTHEQDLDETQIESKAEELYKIFEDEHNSHFKNVSNVEWSLMTNEYREGFRAIARHLVTPHPSVSCGQLRNQLSGVLESERHLMSILRDIGKVFDKNVGVDVGTDELPKLIEGEVTHLKELNKIYKVGRDSVLKRQQLQCSLIDLIVEKTGCVRPRPGDHWGDDKILAELRALVSPQPSDELRELRNDLVTATGHTYTMKDFTSYDLIHEVSDLHRFKQTVVKHLESQYTKSTPDMFKLDNAGLIQLLSKLEIVEPCPHCETQLPTGTVIVHFSPDDIVHMGFERTDDTTLLVKTLVKRSQRLRDVEENYRVLSERVAEAYTYIPADL